MASRWFGICQSTDMLAQSVLITCKRNLTTHSTAHSAKQEWKIFSLKSKYLYGQFTNTLSGLLRQFSLVVN